jgi:hypothetical protein
MTIGDIIRLENGWASPAGGWLAWFKAKAPRVFIRNKPAPKRPSDEVPF